MAEIFTLVLMSMALTSLGGTSSRLARAADLPVSEGIDDDPHRDGVGNFYRAFLEVALGREHRAAPWRSEKRVLRRKRFLKKASRITRDEPVRRDEDGRPEAVLG